MGLIGSGCVPGAPSAPHALPGDAGGWRGAVGARGGLEACPGPRLPHTPSQGMRAGGGEPWGPVGVWRPARGLPIGTALLLYLPRWH